MLAVAAVGHWWWLTKRIPPYEGAIQQPLDNIAKYKMQAWFVSMAFITVNVSS